MIEIRPDVDCKAIDVGKIVTRGCEHPLAALFIFSSHKATRICQRASESLPGGRSPLNRSITWVFNFPHKSVTPRPCQDGVSFGGVVGVVDSLVVVGFGCTSSSRNALVFAPLRIADSIGYLSCA